MDRKVTVNQDGTLFTEMTYTYNDQLSGCVNVTQYKAQDIEGSGQKAAVPVLQFGKEFSHAALSSLADVRKYDEAFLAELPEAVTGSLDLVYDPLRYRYSAAGIIDVRVNFADNTKEMTFFSSHRIREDCTNTTNALECNVSFINRVLLNGAGSLADIVFIDTSHIL